MTAYLRFDAYLIKCVQEGYLYLLDRTGVYVATVAMALYVPVIAVGFRDHPFFNGFLFIVVAVSLSRAYYLQEKQDYARFNAIVEAMEKMPIRHPIQVSFLIMLPVPFIAMDFMWILSSISIVLYLYVLLVKIRDRDKKPFFETAPQETTVEAQ